MNKLLVTVAAAAMALTGAIGAAQAASSVKVGVLTCDVDAGFGYLIGSDKALDCVFKPSKGGKTEHYSGSVKKLGIDVGYTSHEVTLGLGLGGNWLIGGSHKSFALQPWSIQGQVGLNYSLTWTDLTLE